MKANILSLLIFAGPIIVGQLAQMLIGVGDVYMAGQYSTKAVAAIGVANGIVSPVFLLGLGLLMGISPKLALKRGEGEDVTKFMPELINYILMVSVACTAIMLLVEKLVPYFQIEQELVPIIQDYIAIVSWSFFPAYLFFGFKEFLQSFEKVVLPNVISILSVFLNLALNYLFIYGWEFIPSLGVNGLAFASLGIRIFMGLSIVPFIFKYMHTFSLRPTFSKELFLFSFPIAFTFFLEVMAFTLVNVLSGVLGVLEAAANNIVLNIASTAFMIPLSISSAVAVKVGAAFGSKDLESIKNNIKAALLLSCGFMVCTALIFWTTPAFAMQLFTHDLDVINLGVRLLAIVALFQLFDGLQITLGGVLRGLQDSRSPSAMIIIGYWFIGLPFGAYLTFKQSQGVSGLWVGLAVSLAMVSIGLIYVLRKKFKYSPAIAALRSD